MSEENKKHCVKPFLIEVYQILVNGKLQIKITFDEHTVQIFPLDPKEEQWNKELSEFLSQNIGEALRDATKKLVLSAIEHASTVAIQTTGKRLTVKKWIAEQRKKEKARLKEKNKQVASKAGRPTETGILCTIQTVQAGIKAIKYSKQKLTQKVLAEKLGCSTRNIQQWIKIRKLSWQEIKTWGKIRIESK
jgi:DNA-binding transcriptional regulator YiaG